MKVAILPGEKIVIFFKVGSSSSPVVTIVQAVYRGIIIVTEHKSLNGLADVSCHGVSEKSGRYWYQYIDKDKKPQSYDVDTLRIFEGETVMVSSFIED